MYYFSYYLSEIRLRLLYLLIAWTTAFFSSYFYQVELVYLIIRPFLEFQNKFIFLDLTEAFYIILRTALLSSFLINLPYFLYQCWSFFIPSRYVSERIRINKYLVFFCIFFFIEIITIYFFLFPKICEFLVSFEITSQNKLISIELIARLGSYISLLLKFSFIFLVILQIPFLFIYFYSKTWLNCYDLCRNRKIFFFISFLFAAFISPPDIFSQTILASIFFVFFEFLIFLGFFYPNSFKKKQMHISE